MKESKACFQSSMTNDVIAKHVNQIVDVLWYIYGSSDKFASRQSISTAADVFHFLKDNGNMMEICLIMIILSDKQNQ